MPSARSRRALPAAPTVELPTEPARLLAVALATARKALEHLERPDPGRITGAMHPTGRGALSDVVDGIECARTLWQIPRPFVDPWPLEDLGRLALAVRRLARGLPRTDPRTQAAAWSARLMVQGLLALVRLVHADRVGSPGALGELPA